MQKKRLIPYTFNILIKLLSFSLHSIHLQMLICTLFEGWGLRKYVFYIQFNVDNYGPSLQE